MASVVKIKRSSVQGKAPTTSNLETGELALNLRDQKLFSSNGSVVFEIGANNASSHIGTLTVGNTTPFTFPTTDGTNGQVLKTNGSGTLTWQDSASAGENIAFSEFSYTTSNNQLSIGGVDDFGKTLSYTPTNISVFLNGIKLVANTDYSASNGTSIFLASGTANNDTVDIQAFNTVSNFVAVSAQLTANTKTSTSASEVVVDEWDAAVYRSAKYMIQVDNTDVSSQYQVSEVLLVHNGSATFTTEYAEVLTSTRIATTDSDINTGKVRLKVTPTVTNSTIKVTRLAIVV